MAEHASDCALTMAYAKNWRAEPLTPAEAEALAASKPGDPISGDMAGDVLLGMIARHRHDIFHALDAMAEGMRDLAIPHFLAWSALHDYTGRALSVTMEEAGLDWCSLPEPAAA